jgi:regulator of cell morphogenesis and NO signaling
MTIHAFDRPIAVDPGSSLADLAATWAGASRVFHRLGLDFCCQGHRSIAEACRERRLDVAQVCAELLTEIEPREPDADWQTLPATHLIAHIVDHFHADHRRELPRLREMAEKVERVHADRAGCPHGLAAHLQAMQQRLEEHMQKEERVLFPMLLGGATPAARVPVMCLTAEHDEHAKDLRRARELATDFVPPEHACTTWRALYRGLATFERDVMEHIHLENHVLFPMAAP